MKAMTATVITQPEITSNFDAFIKRYPPNSVSPGPQLPRACQGCSPYAWTAFYPEIQGPLTGDRGMRLNGRIWPESAK